MWPRATALNGEQTKASGMPARELQGGSETIPLPLRAAIAADQFVFLSKLELCMSCTVSKTNYGFSPCTHMLVSNGKDAGLEPLLGLRV